MAGPAPACPPGYSCTFTPNTLEPPHSVDAPFWVVHQDATIFVGAILSLASLAALVAISYFAFEYLKQRRAANAAQRREREQREHAERMAGFTVERAQSALMELEAARSDPDLFAEVVRRRAAKVAAEKAR